MIPNEEQNYLLRHTFVSEEIILNQLEKDLGEDFEEFKEYYKYFNEVHQEVSRKSMEKKFKGRLNKQNHE